MIFKRPQIAIEQARRKEIFRKLHQRVGTANEDVMRRFYNITTNGDKPVLIDALTLDMGATE